VVMPRMNGAEAARQIAAGRPDIRVLFMSGYAENIIEDLGKLQAGQGFIQKPFAPGVLGRKVREILEAEIGRSGGAS